MKKHFKKLNQIGAAHLLAPLLVTALIAGVGVYVLSRSHASVPYTSTPLVYSYNTPKWPADQYINTTTATGANTVTQAAQKQDKYYQSAARLSNNGTYIAFTESPSGGGGSSLWIKAIRTPNTSPLRIYTKDIGGVLGNSPLAWSSDNKKIIVLDETYSSTKYAFKSVDVATGAVSLITAIDKRPGGVDYDVWVGRYDMLGDNATLVYERQGNIYSVKTGGTPSSVRANTNSCWLVGRRPGSTNELAYSCWINDSNKLYTKTIAGVEKLVYETAPSKWVNGARNSYITDATWSPGGTTLAMRLMDNTVVDTATCKTTVHPAVVKVAATGGPITLMAWIDETKTMGGCYGGSSNANTIVWNSSNYIGVVADGGIKTVVASSPYQVTKVATLPSGSFGTGLSW